MTPYKHTIEEAIILGPTVSTDLIDQPWIFQEGASWRVAF